MGLKNPALTGVLPSEIWNRILWLRCGPKSGTGFTIEVDDHQFLVTAAYVVEHWLTGTPLERNLNGAWVPIKATRIDPDPDFVDVAIFAPERQLTAAMPVEYGHGGFVFGQDLMILGYPFDVAEFAKEPEPHYLANGSPMPLVKNGSRAWERKASGPGHMTLFVDCYANEGFSGGPVVGYRPMDDQSIAIAGVVSVYVPERQPVMVGDEATPLTARQNPGILLAPGINHVLDGIASVGSDKGAPVRVRRA